MLIMSSEVGELAKSSVRSKEGELPASRTDTRPEEPINRTDSLTGPRNTPSVALQGSIVIGLGTLRSVEKSVEVNVRLVPL